LAGITGRRRAVAVVNGTAALQVCFVLAGVQPGDEVMCPSLTFVATANAIRHCGATPHFIDVCPRRMGLSPAALESRLKKIAVVGPGGVVNRETGNRIAAVCVMHCFGHPADLNGIRQACDAYGIPLIEDAAESLGSTYQGKPTGDHGMLTAVSFNGNKILTTGGGGAILTDDESLADAAKHLTTTAKVPHPYEFTHDEVGWNYRLPNLNAALGLAQLEILEQLVDAKRDLADRYRAAFQSVDGVEFFDEPDDCRSNYWLNTLVLDDDDLAIRNEALDRLNGAGLQSRPIWRPMHSLEIYRSSPRGAMDVTESLYRRVINIPSSAILSPGWAGRVAEADLL
jgi:perosamine synthetase